MTATLALYADLDAPWRERSLCLVLKDSDPELFKAFVDENHERADEARKVCNQCRVRINCLVDAANDPKAEGNRAGYYFSAGAVNADDLKRAKMRDGIKLKTRRKPKEESAEDEGVECQTSDASSADD